MKVQWTLSGVSEIPDPPPDVDPLVHAQRFVGRLTSAITAITDVDQTRCQITEVSVSTPLLRYEWPRPVEG